MASPRTSKPLKTGLAAMPKREAKKIQKLGGLKVSQDRAHMARIGRMGGRKKKHG